jgi:demethylmenaquinone methyltransferase/2-methoxy-6-polyprenyl-1,4-benzoquinol methylase
LTPDNGGMSSTHFGFETVDERDKARKVRGVFDSVAPKYDVMNDVMSMGLHRIWKAYTQTVAHVRPGFRVLDIAGGTGDLSLGFAPKVGPTGMVVHTDINEAMLREGRSRLLDKGLALPTLVCDAEALPFADGYFDSGVSRLRSAQHDPQRPGTGRNVPRAQTRWPLMVLEFSRVAKPLEKAYDWYSFNILPKLGGLIANDEGSYRYLAESIRMHPDQEALRQLMKSAGFGHVDVHNLTGGVVALHVGTKC